MALPDGRVFRYVENGGSAIGEGLVVASEAPAGNHDEDLVVATTGSAGGFTIGVTLGGTAAAKDLYAEGYIFSNLASTTPHEMYKIKGHPAIASSGTGTITIDEPDGFQTAITAGTDTVLVGASSNHTGQLLAIGADTTPALGRLHGKAGVDNEFHTVMLMNLF